MHLELEGKRALVTGSTAGIGLSTARLLAAEGAVVAVNGRTKARVTAAVEAIRRDVPLAEVHGVAADLGTAAGCRHVFESIPDVDILVNNVGIFEPKPFETIPDEDWFRFFETNVMSGVRLSRHYLPVMRARDWGRVVFVSSESALQIPAGDDPLRHDENGADRCRPGDRGDDRRHRHHREQCASWPDGVRGCGNVRRRKWPNGAASTSRRWNASSSKPRAHRLCSNGSRRRTRSRR